MRVSEISTIRDEATNGWRRLVDRSPLSAQADVKFFFRKARFVISENSSARVHVTLWDWITEQSDDTRGVRRAMEIWLVLT